MDEYQRCKIRLYQYLMARGDSLRLKSEQAVFNCMKQKHPSEADLFNAYKCIRDSEFFEMIYREILEYI